MQFEFNLPLLRKLMAIPHANPLLGNIALIWAMSERGHSASLVLETVVIVNAIVVGLSVLSQFGGHTR
ncbi:hypothetical protein [Lentzea jiangxiensis]|uniref:Uncharacterized protein n=1 Tax=Lentzea jiangxiensis TaxID=641025 RepID=A0A1H0PCY7_9PSEU|nr:hypothetical protein [Lentzea jiangxiensis]SDP02854.1 hypothetical protein SAMN05421507_1057 [Lentzea jiangxiensis]